MKQLLMPCFALLTCVSAAQAQAMTSGDRTLEGPAHIRLVGNTSSNSSSNTSSDSGSSGSSYVHTHRWSVDSDDRYGRRSVRGSTRIERYAPPERSYRQRRDRRYHFDDD